MEADLKLSDKWLASGHPHHWQHITQNVVLQEARPSRCALLVVFALTKSFAVLCCFLHSPRLTWRLDKVVPSSDAFVSMFERIMLQLWATVTNKLQITKMGHVCFRSYSSQYLLTDFEKIFIFFFSLAIQVRFSLFSNIETDQDTKTSILIFFLYFEICCLHFQKKMVVEISSKRHNGSNFFESYLWFFKVLEI